MSMIINCPNCGHETDMSGVQDVYYDDDNVEIDCDECQSILIAQPNVKISFSVSVEKRVRYKSSEVTNGKA